MLKNCPFCGSAAYLSAAKDAPGTYLVGCDNHPACPCPMFEIRGKAAAIAAWNMRARAPSLHDLARKLLLHLMQRWANKLEETP